MIRTNKPARRKPAARLDYADARRNRIAHRDTMNLTLHPPKVLCDRALPANYGEGKPQ